MGKRIMVLNGSPRPAGNTAALIEAFSQGAQSAGHQVTSFALDSMDIHGCKGCYGGNDSPDSPCVQKDDMDKIYPVYHQADIVVLASPLYFWNITGQLRTAVDRLFAAMEGDRKSPPKGCILLMVAGGEDFGLMPDYHNDLVRRLGWENLGSVLAGGVNNLGDIRGRPELEQARALGAGIR